MAKCDFNKVAKQLYWNRTSAWGFSCKFTSYFQKTFSKEHIWKVRDSNLLRNEKSSRNTNKTFTSKSRSSHPDLFCKKRCSCKFCRILRKTTVSKLQATTLLKNRLWHRCFPLNFAKFLRTPFYKEYLRWLLLWKINLLRDFSKKHINKYNIMRPI